MKRILHVGCGSKANELPPIYRGYQETRLDSNAMVDPDIVASIVSMPMVESEQFDVVLASHVLEHCHFHEVAMALKEFCRVLKPKGFADIRVPDLQSIGGRLALDEAGNALYNSAQGMIAPLDMIYGHRGQVGAGNTFMAHKSGFTTSVLKFFMSMAGFDDVVCDTKAVPFELRGTGTRTPSIFDKGGPGDGLENTAKTAAQCLLK
jgi:SAM-dependent methyltransferase